MNNTQDHHLDALLAQHIMGWTYVEPSIAKKDPPNLPDDACVYTIGDLDGGGPWVYYREVGAGDFTKWSPTRFDGDALDVVKQIQWGGHKVTLTLQALPTREPVKYLCTISPGPTFEGIQAVCAGATTLHRAICTVVEEWLHTREERHP